MARTYNDRMRLAIKEYIKELELSGASPDHIKGQARVLKRCALVLASQGLDAPPSKIGREHLNALKAAFPAGAKNPHSLRNAHFHVESFRTFLRRTGHIPPRIIWPHWTTKRFRSDTADFTKALQMSMTARDWRAVVFLLVEGLGSRRIGVLRLRKDMISPTQLILKDKGRAGGKYRTIPLTPEAYETLRWCIDLRTMELEEARTKHPGLKDPDRLIIRANGPDRDGFSKRSADNIMERINRRAGVHLEHHGNRRMYIREIVQAAKQAQKEGNPVSPVAIMQNVGLTDWQRVMDYAGEFEDESRQLVTAVQAARYAKTSTKQ